MPSAKRTKHRATRMGHRGAVEAASGVEGMVARDEAVNAFTPSGGHESALDLIHIASVDCWCRPVRDDVEDGVWLHCTTTSTRGGEARPESTAGERGRSRPLSRRTPPILFGADPIGEFLFPDEPQRRRQRRVRRLISEVPVADRLPTFKLGGTICARPSTLLTWLAEREGRP
jgi:hypothetical protein